jgi:glycosyltransferase involved in cell wall biosynthesis
LQALADRGGARVVLRLEYIPDEEVAHLLDGVDVVVLPFRRVTTSGSAILALSHGRPLLVPTLAALADLPRDAVVRYSGGVPALTAALARLARADRETLAAMSHAARRHAATVTWPDIARQTTAAMVSVLDGTGSLDQSQLAKAP